MGVPNTFGTATSAIPLSQLDANFNTPITLGNTAIQLGDTVTTLNNMTLANVTISSGNVTITNVAITTANVSGTANISTLVVVGNATVGGNTTITGNITAANANVTTNLVLSGGTANGVAYLNTSKVLTTGSALVFDGTNLGIGLTNPGAKLDAYQEARVSFANSNQYYFSIKNTSGNPSLDANGSAAYLSFGTTNIGDTLATERMRISSATGGVGAVGIGYTSLTSVGNNGLAVLGNVGIGTSSPVSRLEIKDTTNNTALTVTSSYEASLQLVNGGGSEVSVINAGGSNILSLRTANNEKARIDSSGNLLVGGITSAINSGLLSVGGRITAKTTTAGSESLDLWNSDTTGDNYFAQFSTETSITPRGSITYNRVAGLTAYNTMSDYRSKDILGPVIDSGALIDSTPVYMGKMKGATQERPMFIAHETPAYAHTGEKDAVDADGKPVYQQMDASSLIPVMWAEIQSLRKRLAAANL